jgi:hypothetical protein
LPEADTNTLLLPCDIPIKDAITQMAVSVRAFSLSALFVFSG